MTRENNYTIEISFENDGRTRNLYNGQVPYYGSSTFKDEFSISNKQISIIAKRSSNIPLDEIFYNHFSSLYNQIIKGLIYYYASLKKYTKITSIKVSRTRLHNILNEKTFDDSQFNQVLDSSFQLKYQIEPTRLMEIFEETQKGQTMLIAISYLLISNTTSSESDKFEKLWKSFNRIFTQISGEKKDFNCLRSLRQFIIHNPGILTLSTSKVAALTTHQLRNAIRWRAMILDNYDTEVKTAGFRDFVLRYSDKRIMEIIQQTKYGYRETYLRNLGDLEVVDNHIKSSIASNIVNDNEVVSLLTGKYMYFVRNKTFHGEKVDSSFRLSVNKEDLELKFLNNILEPYLVDLINANDKY